jgi:hypothetical protein
MFFIMSPSSCMYLKRYCAFHSLQPIVCSDYILYTASSLWSQGSINCIQPQVSGVQGQRTVYCTACRLENKGLCFYIVSNLRYPGKCTLYSLKPLVLDTMYFIRLPDFNIQGQRTSHTSNVRYTRTINCFGLQLPVSRDYSM